MARLQALAAALGLSSLLACDSYYPCYSPGPEERAVFTQGDGMMSVECGHPGQTFLPSTRMSLRSWETGGEHVYLTTSHFAVGMEARIEFPIYIPTTLADGSYRLDEASPRITIRDSRLESIQSGRISFKRTRNVPYADIKDPELGEYAYSIEFTLELEGTLTIPGTPCERPARFKLPPFTARLNQVSIIKECHRPFND